MKLKFAYAALLIALTSAGFVLAPTSAAVTTPSSNVSVEWNEIAVNAVRAAGTVDGVTSGSPARPLYQTEGLLYTAYVQAAVYDATMKISHRYQPYHDFEAFADSASLEAAVIASAYNTLIFYLEDPSGTLGESYATAIAALPGDETTESGIAAADIEELRANDGRNTPMSVACPTPTSPPTPGADICAPPPSVQAIQTPWLASVRPFLLPSQSAFRAPPPPSLDSATFHADLDETRSYGAVDSTLRTDDQQATARFWNANVIDQVNQAPRAPTRRSTT